ncbi:MAG TPA: HlyD family efflux transporter periplasmic adaptor subunit [Puia sp.]|jgi:multidrug efflux pump subunit AcrA (membrane-fusion protein)|nr:HlyD family efflux transporter periplasmic adaptor subunit [Puia sp.]
MKNSRIPSRATFPVIPAILSLLLPLTGCHHTPSTTPQYRDIVDAVFASGSTQAKQQYRITAYADGYLQRSFVAEDDSVHTGQLLFRIANDLQRTQIENAATNYEYALRNASDKGPQIQQLESQIAQAQRKKTTDSLNYERYQRLLPTHAVAQVDYDNARLTYEASTANLTQLQKNLEDLRTNLSLNTENTRAQLREQQENNSYFAITGATNGRIENVYKKDGDLIRKGDVIADLGAGLQIARLLIAEEDIQRIRLGQRVLVSLNTDKVHVFNATVTKIYPSFNTNDQAFIAEATFDPLPPNLRNGTQLEANIILGEKKHALVIPTSYLLPGDSVILAADQSHVPVKTGIHTLEWVEITGGLRDNQSIQPVNPVK